MEIFHQTDHISINDINCSLSTVLNIYQFVIFSKFTVIRRKNASIIIIYVLSSTLTFFNRGFPSFIIIFSHHHGSMFDNYHIVIILRIILYYICIFSLKIAYINWISPSFFCPLTQIFILKHAPLIHTSFYADNQYDWFHHNN